MPHLPFCSKDDSKKGFLKEHPFWEGGGLVWHPFRHLSPIVRSSNHPGAKSLVLYGIESILSPNRQRRPLTSLPSDSSSMIQCKQIKIMLVTLAFKVYICICYVG